MRAVGCVGTGVQLRIVWWRWHDLKWPVETAATSKGGGRKQAMSRTWLRSNGREASGTFESYGYGGHDYELSRGRKRLWR